MSNTRRIPAGPPSSPVETPPTGQKTRLIVTVTIALVLVAVGAFAVFQATRPAATVAVPSPSVTGAQSDILVRADSRRLNDVPNAKATFVEFLDFECEACGAIFPAIEQLRETYGDRVSFVIRYFPIRSHFNAQRAAQAVEAAAQQGKLEAMYTKMYQAQKEWAEQQVPKDDVFRQYAQELGLDMGKWDAAYNSKETLERIQRDTDDGTALGVQGTPTFFFNGKLIEPKQMSDLTKAFDGSVR